MSLLTCQNVTFSYEGQAVLSDIQFTVNRGDYLCIIGENGAGKSTLIKGILNLKKPSAGQILTGDGLTQSEIGYLPQQTQVQKDFPASVLEVVISGRLNSLHWNPFYRKEDKKIALQQMERLKIGQLEKKCYRDLSGGQQQRVLLARALCATKKILLLDEPITGLDPIVAGEFYEIIGELNRTEQITIIMVSHDVRGVTDYASHILHLGKKQLFYGRSTEYKSSSIGKRFLMGGESDV